MKCLSLLQPWATLMAIDEKRFETRGPMFTRKYSGELAIASSASFPLECRALCHNTVFDMTLLAHGIHGARSLPLGFVLCVVEVVGAGSAEDVAAVIRAGRPGAARHELEFGNYGAGRTVLLTRNVRRLREPVPVERIEKGVARAGGALGIYALSPACEAAVRAQLEAKGDSK